MIHERLIRRKIAKKIFLIFLKNYKCQKILGIFFQKKEVGLI